MRCDIGLGEYDAYCSRSVIAYIGSIKLAVPSKPLKLERIAAKVSQFPEVRTNISDFTRVLRSAAGHKEGGNAVTSPGRLSIDPKLSPDGTKVLNYVPHGESYGPGWGDVRNEVWVQSLVDGSEIQIPAEGSSSWNSLWSPDSKQLIYDREDLRTGERQLMLWSSQSTRKSH
jgi:hypothetical protein